MNFSALNEKKSKYEAIYDADFYKRMSNVPLVASIGVDTANIQFVLFAAFLLRWLLFLLPREILQLP